MPSLIHKSGPKENNASVSRAALCQDRQSLINSVTASAARAHHPGAENQFEKRQICRGQSSSAIAKCQTEEPLWTGDQNYCKEMSMKCIYLIGIHN